MLPRTHTRQKRADYPLVLSFFHVVSSHPSKDTQMTLQTGCKCVMQVIHKTPLALQECLTNLTQYNEVDADKCNRFVTLSGINELTEESHVTC